MTEKTGFYKRPLAWNKVENVLVSIKAFECDRQQFAWH